MHVKCIDEFVFHWVIFLNNCMIYDVAKMFYINLEYFYTVLIYLILNSGWQKNLLLVFFTFRKLRNSKKGKVRVQGLEILIRIQQDNKDH
jgi:hypothetical protein